MPLVFTGDKSTLVQVMVWCRQATSHYLNQCWLRSPTPYGITRPQWVNIIEPYITSVVVIYFSCIFHCDLMILSTNQVMKSNSYCESALVKIIDHEGLVKNVYFLIHNYLTNCDRHRWSISGSKSISIHIMCHIYILYGTSIWILEMCLRVLNIKPRTVWWWGWCWCWWLWLLRFWCWRWKW